MAQEARNTHRYHIIGIGGIGMSAIAEIMHARGYFVQGSDLSESENVIRLRDCGVQVFVGHSPEHLKGATRIIISTAVKPGNPEFDAAKDRSMIILSRADMLAELMSDFQTVSITGTHGKTTTTSITAHLLEFSGKDPTVLNGGIINNWGTNARIGKGKLMVVEADESDGTFIKLPTRIGVVTNIDPEHLDYYGSVDVLHNAFLTFFRSLPQDGWGLAGIDHPVVKEMIEKSEPEKRSHLLTYGIAEEADLQLLNWTPSGSGSVFDVKLSNNVPGGEDYLERFQLNIPGRYNAVNAIAAVGVARILGVSKTQIRNAISNFEGVGRRFTQTGEWNGIKIYDDYAHHPAEISEVLRAASQSASRRVLAIVQPHRFTRLRDLFDEFSHCFGSAHTVIVAPVYAAGESPIDGIDHVALKRALIGRGHKHVLSVDDPVELAPLISQCATAGDLIIGLGAGTITHWMHALPDQLANLPVNWEHFA